jgi:hypothetical protein
MRTDNAERFFIFAAAPHARDPRNPGFSSIDDRGGLPKKGISDR